MDSVDGALMLYALATFIVLALAAGLVLFLALICWAVKDLATRDRSQPYWRGPRSPLSGGRRR